MNQGFVAGTLPGLVMAALCLGLAGYAVAADGVLEINQACAESTGCFPGDTLGFPVRIANPGSYVLTGNLEVLDANTTAIFVDARDVTIDLNGFAMKGPVNCLGAGSGISCMPAGTGRGIDVGPGNRRVSVRNGMVRGFGDDGLSLEPEARVEHVTATSNGGTGIDTGGFSLVVNCIAQQNGLDGIGIGAAGTVARTISSRNGRFGITTGFPTRIHGNNVFENGDHGINGGELISGNTVWENERFGIRANPGNVFDNFVYGNLEHQIEAFNGSRISGNTLYGNTTGFNALQLGPDVGYAENIIRTGGSHGTVSGGVDLGGNLCNGAACP